MPVRLGPMTVAQLIDKLRKLPPTAFVHSGIVGSVLKPSMEEMAELTVVLRWPEADTPGMDKRRERLRELVRNLGETRDD
jgi:hypothetical protein